MLGRSIAWVRDRCTLEGAYRPLLYAVATHAGKHYADCTASAATLARASGLSSRWVKKLLPELVDMGILEQLDSGSGRRPACYRIAPPLWVEHSSSASGLVEHEAYATNVTEGSSGEPTSPLQGEVLARSGEPTSPQSTLAAGAKPRCGEVGNPVVVNSPFRSGEVLPPLSWADGSQEKYVEEKNIEDKNVPRSRSLASARSNAGQALAPDAMAPQPPPDSLLRELERRGLRRPTGAPRPRSTDPPARSREEQLAELERIAARDAADAAKSAENGEASA
jgi:hypothetical protein